LFALVGVVVKLDVGNVAERRVDRVAILQSNDVDTVALKLCQTSALTKARFLIRHDTHACERASERDEEINKDHTHAPTQSTTYMDHENRDQEIRND
jgi:hypothetical protein